MDAARSLRILQVVTDRDRRGAQVFATDLEAGLRLAGHHVHTVALARSPFGDGLDIDVLGPSRFARATLTALRAAAREADVVVAHGSSTLPACALGLLGTGTPFVYRQISDPEFWASTWPRRMRVAVFLRRAAGVVALAPSAADALVRHYRIARDRIDVSPNAVPGDAFSPPDAAQRAAARRRFGLPDDAFVAAAVGAITHEKGADLAIDAVALTPGVQLLVAGSGAERAHAQALAERTCPDRVTFLEQLDDMQPVYHAADVVLLPSRGGESMPAVLIEAALCGRPSITTDVGSITDIVEDGVTGRIIPVDDARAVADALVHLRDHRDIAAHWGVAAQERARARLTIDSVEPAWTAVLRRCAR